MYDSVIVSLAYPDIDTYFNCNNANAGRSIYNPFYKGRINLGRGTDIALKLSVGCAAKDITLTFAPV